LADEQSLKFSIKVMNIKQQHNLRSAFCFVRFHLHNCSSQLR